MRNDSARLLRVWSLYLWSIAVMSLIRLLHVIWNFSQLREPGLSELTSAFLHGARFDLAASAWLLLPLLLLTMIPLPARATRIWELVILGLFYTFQIPFWFFNLVDIEFVNFVGRRLSADVLFILGEAQGKVGGFLSAYGALIALAGLILFAGSLGAALILRASRPLEQVGFLKGWKAGVAMALGSLVLVVILTRGGFQEKPIHFVNSQVFAQPSMNLVVLNSTFTILKSLSQKELPKFDFFEKPEEVFQRMNGRFTEPSLLEGRRPVVPQNVVVLILESFGREYMGEINGVKGYTPFLDSLVRRSLFFKNGYANGRRSIEGIPAVLSGVPALMNEPFVTSTFSNGDFPGLGRTLVEKGYQTHFFHGGNNGTMHFDAYTESAGMQHYWGAHEYPDSSDHDGVWGIYDGPMLQWMKSKIDGMPDPFFATFFSLSSHNPYLIPEDREDRYAEGPLPILKTILYTDDSLREFFEAAEKTDWYASTLFVITADHTYLPYLPEFDHSLARFQVPILFFHPGYQWPEEIDREQVVQQIDILPSVLDFLGVRAPVSNRLASSVFVPGDKTATVFVDGQATLISKDHFLVWPLDQEAKLYSIRDPKQTQPLEQVETKNELHSKLKASLQYFADSMRDNRWR